MTHVTCRLTAKNRDQLRKPTLGNRAWANFFTFYLLILLTCCREQQRKHKQTGDATWTHGSVEQLGAELGDVPRRLKRHSDAQVSAEIVQLGPIRLYDKQPTSCRTAGSERPHRCRQITAAHAGYSQYFTRYRPGGGETICPR